MPRIIDPMIAELEQEAAATRRLLERVPADKFDWKPHSKSMALGQLAQHIALLPARISGWLLDDKLDVGAGPPPSPPSLTTTADLVRASDEAVAAAKANLDQLDDARVMATWKLMREGREIFALPRVTVVRAVLLNHWYHHRGQLTVYLRQLDVPLPATYGSSADQNLFA